MLVSGELGRHTAWPAYCHVRHIVVCLSLRRASVVSSRVHHIVACPTCSHWCFMSSRVLRVVTCHSCRHVSVILCAVHGVDVEDTRQAKPTGTVVFNMSVIDLLSFIHCPVSSTCCHVSTFPVSVLYSHRVRVSDVIGVEVLEWPEDCHILMSS